VRLLLDTCTLLWWISEPSRVTDAAQSCVKSAENAVFVSVVSAWEVSIKERMKRFADYPTGAGATVLATLESYRFEVMPIFWPHAVRAGELPLHHRDPFDRMLVAQAQLEGLKLVSPDPLFGPYDVERIWD